MAGLTSDFGQRELELAEKLRGINWVLVLLVCDAAGFGFAMLYSAADGNMQPWAATPDGALCASRWSRCSARRFSISGYWFRVAYWAYAVALALVVAVDLRGFVGWARGAGSISGSSSCSRPR